jgi:hypothetical protein
MLRKGEDTLTEGGSSRSHYLESLLWKRLWTCRETDYNWIISTGLLGLCCCHCTDGSKCDCLILTEFLTLRSFPENEKEPHSCMWNGVSATPAGIMMESEHLLLRVTDTKNYMRDREGKESVWMSVCLELGDGSECYAKLAFTSPGLRNEEVRGYS